LESPRQEDASPGRFPSCDIAVIDKRSGTTHIFEFKICEHSVNGKVAASDAVKQIVDRKYYNQLFQPSVSDATIVGVPSIGNIWLHGVVIRHDGKLAATASALVAADSSLRKKLEAGAADVWPTINTAALVHVELDSSQA